MIKVFNGFVTGRIAVALLLLRVVVGSAFVLHGLQKLGSEGGVFGWMGPTSPVPSLFQGLALLSELGGGLALIVGLLTPLAAFGIACTMVVAFALVHLPSGHPFVGKGGKPSFESAAFYLTAMLVFLLAGPGAYSLDALIFGRGRAGQATSETPPVLT